MVGERSCNLEAERRLRGGVATREYADTSSDKSDENSDRRKPKVSWGRFVLPGLAGSSGQAVRRSRCTGGQHSSAMLGLG